MADTYTQLYVHIVFSVKGRHALIPKHHKLELHKYITGIITNKKQKLIQINSMPDHIHILIGMTPDVALSGLVKDIKVNSTRFINQKRWTMGQFAWQTGFGAFSYSHSQIPQVATYIENQEVHHSHQTFRDEYLKFLERFEVAYDLKYVFDAVADHPSGE